MATLRTLASACRTNHRLRSVLVRGLALVALSPAELDGSLLGQAAAICGGSPATLLAVCNG